MSLCTANVADVIMTNDLVASMRGALAAILKIFLQSYHKPSLNPAANF
jgi:hypothetical protein